MRTPRPRIKSEEKRQAHAPKKEVNPVVPTKRPAADGGNLAGEFEYEENVKVKVTRSILKSGFVRELYEVVLSNGYKVKSGSRMRRV